MSPPHVGLRLGRSLQVPDRIAEVMRQNVFDILMAKYEWQPICGCPGRYILAGGTTHLSINELVDGEIAVEEANFDSARDLVCYCYFEGGGLISYKKTNGYLHAHCSEWGMARKMAVLGGPNFR